MDERASSRLNAVNPILGVHEAEVPPPGFDPLFASPDDLERYWLPSRPNPATEPVFYRHWEEMLSPVPTFAVAKSFEPPRPAAIDDSREVGAPQEQDCRLLGGGSRIETSRNWSGAYVGARDALRFTRVVGRWNMPAILKAGIPPEKIIGSLVRDMDTLPYHYSTWIGLGGKRRWMRSLPQMGTEQVLDMKSGQLTQNLWWQWWVRGMRSLPQLITGVSVAAGDTVLCSLTAVQPDVVRFHVMVRNDTNGTRIFTTVSVQCLVPVEGSTAEWIVERPCWPFVARRDYGGRDDDDIDPGPMFPMPDYGTITFGNCAASMGAEQEVDLSASKLIRLVQTVPDLGKTASISIPRRLDRDRSSIILTYSR